jgi:hypothetical protein
MSTEGATREPRIVKRGRVPEESGEGGNLDQGIDINKTKDRRGYIGSP